MDRNSIIGIIIIVGILVIYSIINKPSEEEKARRDRIRDSLIAVQQEQVEKELALQKQQDSIKNIPVTTNETEIKQSNIQELGEFANAASGTNEFYTLENELLKLTISTKGGRPYSVILKDYKTSNAQPLVLFSGDSTIFGFSFGYQNRSISTNDLYFTPSVNVKNLYTQGESVSLSMKLNAADNKYIEYVYTMHKDEYMVDFRINMVGLEDISTSFSESIDLNWEMYAPQQEKGKKNENIYTTIYYKPFGDDVDYFRSRTGKEKQSEEIPTKVEWIAFKNQFFSSVLIAGKPFENAKIEYLNLPVEDKFLKKFTAEIGVPFSHSANESVDMKFYFGPNKYNLLKKYKVHELKDLVTVGSGIIKWINQFVIISIFDWLSKYIGNYGIIILLLTIIIKVGLLPLTYRSYLSQA
jgi:YidC/Oxa1 family membrane protein insertase